MATYNSAYTGTNIDKGIAGGILVKDSGVTQTELSYLSGVTENLQTRYNKHYGYSGVGSGSTAAQAKAYFLDATKVPPGTIKTVYENSGNGFTLIFSKSTSDGYGTILKYGYTDTAIRILRYQASTWKSEDWELVTATPNSHTHNYAASASAGGPANYVKWEAGSANEWRRVPFAYESGGTTNSQVNLLHNNNLKFNSSTNALKIGNIGIGDASALSTPVNLVYNATNECVSFIFN